VPGTVGLPLRLGVEDSTCDTARAFRPPDCGIFIAMNKIFHILLIEDDPMTVFAMTASLSDAGHVVSSATSVPEALTALSKPHGYDVILLDLRLGPDRGQDIFLELKRRGVPFVPVIILSSYSDAEIQEAANVIPAAGALRKPVPTSRVCEVIERAVA
jgi:DNA-binding NtrC family response regulator